MNENPLTSKGILVGSNEALEWLLPWWWERYSACNTLPVVFVDFGLSKAAQKWCAERGTLIALDPLPPQHFKSENKQWAEGYGASYETAREGWFRKPLALLQSSFDITLWCDLDCEILKNIEELFSHVREGPFLAMTKEKDKEDSTYPIYNGGVILYRKDTPLLKDFAKRALSEAQNFWGDDRLLSYLIDKSQFPVDVLPALYNWRMSEGIPASASIIHWVGEWGKNYIRMHGGLKPALANS